MSTPLSFCDISARFGQTFAPPKATAKQTGWDFNQLFLDYMRKVRLKHMEDQEDAEEDALMALIDAMNPPKDRRVDPEAEVARSLAKAEKAIAGQHEDVQEDGTKRTEWFDPMESLTIQVLVSCLGGRFRFEQDNELQEDQDQEERLKVTEQRELSDPSDPDSNKKEV